MIVLGADTHKRSHTIAAVAAATGELLGERTVPVGRRGFGVLLRWARGLDGERVWALEDCRHVSGGLERFLIARGERVLRIPTHLSATARRSSRQRGKSDPIDALAVARVALQEGLESFPVAHLDGPELDLRLLVDHRERLVRQRVGLNNTLQWHLHDLWPELELPGCSLFFGRWAPRVARRLARAEQTMRARIARDELRRIRDLSRTIKALEREIAQLVGEIAPQLLAEPGFGPLTAAKLVGEIAGAQRFATAAKLARAAGVAPIPASSGNTRRQRLDQGGNRQINAALHRVIVTRARPFWKHRHTHQFLDIEATDAIASGSPAVTLADRRQAAVQRAAALAPATSVARGLPGTRWGRPHRFDRRSGESRVRGSPTRRPIHDGPGPE